MQEVVAVIRDTPKLVCSWVSHLFSGFTAAKRCDVVQIRVGLYIAHGAQPAQNQQVLSDINDWRDGNLICLIINRTCYNAWSFETTITLLLPSAVPPASDLRQTDCQSTPACRYEHTRRGHSRYNNLYNRKDRVTKHYKSCLMLVT